MSSVRVSLDEHASEAVQRMMGSLRDDEKSVAISPSGLVSWIVQNFERRHFEKEKTRIINLFFCPGKYLRKNLRNVRSKSDMEVILKDALSKISNTREKK